MEYYGCDYVWDGGEEKVLGMEGIGVEVCGDRWVWMEG